LVLYLEIREVGLGVHTHTTAEIQLLSAPPYPSETGW